jgi:hypothetical protein
MSDGRPEPSDEPVPDDGSGVHDSEAPTAPTAAATPPPARPGGPPPGPPPFGPPPFGPPPSGPPPGYGPPPFAYGAWKEPWIVPRRRGAVVLIAIVAAIVLLGAGMLAGAALRGGVGDRGHHPAQRFERNGPARFPGRVGQFPARPGQRNLPRPGRPIGSNAPSAPAAPSTPSAPAPSSS